MKAEVSRICAIALGLVVCAAVQDLAPVAFGAKPPFLLLFGCFAGIPAAIVAGLFADALSGLPFGCSPAVFAVAALLMRWLGRQTAVQIAAAAAAAAAYQMWLLPWSTGRLSAPPLIYAAAFAAILAPAACAMFSLVRRWIGIDRKAGGERR